MKNLLLLLISAIFLSCSSNSNKNSENVDSKQSNQAIQHAIVIHGGAGYYGLGKNPAMDSLYRSTLLSIVEFGDSLLTANTSALDVVVLCIARMEDNPLFNAGKGSVLNEDGKVSMDASIMNGENEKAGAVAGMSFTRHPILAARRVMDSTSHVMLSGEGAEHFASAQNLEKMPAEWFVTDESLQTWKSEIQKIKEKKFGTVGCVVLDKNKNLAAGTSTGGMSMKKWGRIGDSPIIGAGTYASNASCAVSCTGHGEYFIRNVVAYDLAARMNYLHESLDSAANLIIKNKLEKQNAKGGLIALDAKGNISMSFNTPTMFRAYKKAGEKAEVKID